MITTRRAAGTRPAPGTFASHNAKPRAGAPVDWWKRAAAHRTERLNHSSNRVGPRRGFAPGASPRLPITAP
jgi:hypothetical protein